VPAGAAKPPHTLMVAPWTAPSGTGAGRCNASKRSKACSCCQPFSHTLTAALKETTTGANLYYGKALHST